MPDFTNKIEKIASALYLVTSFFDDKEPLKWRIRTVSTILVSQESKDKLSVLRELASLCSLAKTAGFISDVNYNILTQELSKLEQESEKPLDLAFSHEVVSSKMSLPLPQNTDNVKDNIIEKPVLKEFGIVSVKKNSRQSVIIGLLKRKKEIMIKDVSPLITGCSEKTIQRELSAMVKSGLILKTGEKRWSRYSLAHP